MWSHQVRRFSLNRAGIWFDQTWSALEKGAAKRGRGLALKELFTKYGLLSSNRLLHSLAARLDHTESVPAAEQTRVTDNSLLLFYSPSVGKYLPRIRFWELVVPVSTLVFAKTWIPAMTYGLFAWFHQPHVVSASRLLVVRMDLLPHSESILFTKVGIFGRVRTEEVPIKNLQKISPMLSQHSYFEDQFSGVHEQYMFKDVETGHEYAFEKYGVWLDENLKLPLIN